MIVFATIDDVNGVTFEARGDYRPGLRSTSYYDPDEPATLDDVVVRVEGSEEWICPEDVATLTLEDVDEALLEAAMNP